MDGIKKHALIQHVEMNVFISGLKVANLVRGKRQEIGLMEKLVVVGSEVQVLDEIKGLKWLQDTGRSCLKILEER